MIRTIAFSALLLSSLLASPARAADEPKKIDLETSDPRAAVVISLFNGALANDISEFKACFSKTMTEKIKDDGKATEMAADFAKKYKQLFKEAKPADLHYTYEGDDKEGKIFLATKDDKAKISPKLRVVKEGDAWKVNER